MSPRKRLTLDERLASLRPKPRRKKGTGSVYAEGDGFRGEIFIAGSRQRVRAATEAGAWAKLEAIKRGDDPAKAVPRSETVESWMSTWLETLDRLKDRTRVGYETIAEAHIYPRLGPVALTQLSTPAVVEFLNSMRRAGYSNSTISNTRNVLSSALAAAREAGKVSDNVASGIKVGQSNSGFVVEGFDERMAVRILDALQEHQWYDLYALLLYTGIRLGEALGLTWDRVHLAKRELTITVAETRLRAEADSGHKTQRGFGSPKSSKTRTAPLPDEAVRLLWRRYHKMGDPKTGLVFPGVRDKTKPLAGGWALREFKKELEAAGLPVMRLHDLRHACLSLLLAKGVPLTTVSKLAGHANTEITARLYAHVLSGAEREAVENLTFFGPRRGGVAERPIAPVLKTGSR